MRRRTIAWAVLLVIAGSTTAGETSEVVSIVMNGSYFSEPANLHFLVDVEPDEENRFLWVEADSDSLYRASEVTLHGAKEKRLHAFVFHSLPGGRYTLRAEVRSRSAVRGLATRSIVVAGTNATGRYPGGHSLLDVRRTAGPVQRVLQPPWTLWSWQRSGTISSLPPPVLTLHRT